MRCASSMPTSRSTWTDAHAPQPTTVPNKESEKKMRMNLSVSALAIAPLALAILSGCDDDGAATPVELTYDGKVVDALDGSPLVGVELCITSPTGLPCVTTDAQGHYVLAGLPATTRVVATVEKEGYFPVSAAFITRTTDFTIDTVLLKTELVKAAFVAANITFDTSKGALLVRAYDPALGLNSTVAGIQGEISPDAGDGPIYNDSSSIPSAATETSTSGTWAVVNLDAGTYQVRSTGSGRVCPGTFHWPGDKGAGWIETPVKAGHVSYVYVDCPVSE